MECKSIALWNKVWYDAVKLQKEMDQLNPRLRYSGEKQGSLRASLFWGGQHLWSCCSADAEYLKDHTQGMRCGNHFKGIPAGLARAHLLGWCLLECDYCSPLSDPTTSTAGCCEQHHALHAALAWGWKSIFPLHPPPSLTLVLMGYFLPAIAWLPASLFS